MCIDSDTVKQASFSIHSENSFASGKYKRPRGPRGSLAVLTPTVDIHTRALLYYLQRHLQELAEVPGNSRGLPECVSAWRNSRRTCSMVDLALSSMALAIFGRTENHLLASTEASKSYCNVLRIAQRRIACLATSALDEQDIDSCLLAISLMNRYEVAAHHAGAYDASIQNFSHYSGVIVVLKVWYDKLADRTATFIIKQTRRELIKSAIVKSRMLPDWLLDGARFGEQSLELDYDQITARLARLQYTWRRLEGCHESKEGIENLEMEARNLDTALQDWSDHVPTECSPQRHFLESHSPGYLPTRHIYSSLILSYPKPGYAAAWCQLYAMRMLINSIRSDLLEARQQFLSSSDYELQQRDCIANMREMGDSIAGSIPSSLERVKIDLNPMTMESHPTINKVENIKPHSASLLMWSLMIACRVEYLDSQQKLWLRSELDEIGRMTGDGRAQFFETT